METFQGRKQRPSRPDRGRHELTCPSVSRGTEFQKSSEHSGSGSASTWAQRASDSADRFHSYCTFYYLTSHSLSIAIKKKTSMSVWDKPSWLYAHSGSAVHTPTHTHSLSSCYVLAKHPFSGLCMSKFNENAQKSYSGTRWIQLMLNLSIISPPNLWLSNSQYEAGRNSCKKL